MNTGFEVWSIQLDLTREWNRGVFVDLDSPNFLYALLCVPFLLRCSISRLAVAA